MTKKDLAEVIYHRHGGLLKKEALNLVDLIFSLIAMRLKRGEKVKISSFGVFFIRRKNEREVVNPQTGERQSIPSHYSVVFKPSQLFVKRLNLNSTRMTRYDK
ncbi:MAG: HU family DNA-binding protein [Acidobacteria bacterium]|nr:HU family DNA-binding protein [Acidobacteriota bacterium]